MRPTLLLWLVGSTGAFAADVTEMPPKLRGDVGLAYDGSLYLGAFQEDGVQRGKRYTETQKLGARFEFAPIEGLSVVLGLPGVLREETWFPEATQMVFEPGSGTGSYAAGDPLTETPSFKGSGLQGLVLGVAVAPFAERYKKTVGVSWRIDAAFRTPTPKHTLFSVGANGQRGAAPGGAGVLVGAAFSHDAGKTEPWLDLDIDWELPATIDVTWPDGETQRAIKIQPASAFDFRGGVELVAFENVESASRFAVDLHAGFGYRTWADLPSGFYLPSVLPGSRSIPVTRSDYIAATAGVAFDFDVNRWFGMRFGADGRYYSPFQIEHTYPVYTTADSFEVAWTVQAVGRVRGPKDRR